MRKLSDALEVETVEGSFETLDDFDLGPANGIWCAASLLHVPKEEIESVLGKLFRMLHPTGRLYLTIRLGEGAKWDRFDDADGNAERFIQLYSADEMEAALVKVGFAIKSVWVEDSTWGRPSKWLSVVSEKPAN